MFEYLLEKAIINISAVLAGAFIAKLIIGGLLNGLGLNNYARTAVYSLVGTGFGIWSYSANDIPNRAFEVQEALILGGIIFIYSFFIIGLIVYFSNRNKKENIED